MLYYMTVPTKNRVCHIKDSSKNHLKKDNKAGKKTNRKAAIPKKLREEVWNHYNKGKYDANCFVPWCTRKIDVFNFHVGHDIPESEGGKTEIINLKPICANCNLSMGYRFTITDWSKLKLKKQNTFQNIDLYKLSYSLISAVSIILNLCNL